MINREKRSVRDEQKRKHEEQNKIKNLMELDKHEAKYVNTKDSVK